MRPDRLTIRLDNDLSEIAGVAEAVENFCSRQHAPAKTALHINLAIDELLTNTISYGFPDGGRHQIVLELACQGDEIIIDLVDGATGFNPLEDAPPPDLVAPLRERRVGGLGVHLVKTVMDAVSYRREEDRNHLRLTKRFAAES